MATKDNASALLSKVAKFVRNPTTNWEDLDKPVPEAESGYSKQALKEMIERKRRNDFVRKREFDQLRRLRNRDPAAPPDAAEQAGRPSFYQSSMPSNLDERAHTLKKIDEIEAQMSKQWWKGKPVEGAPPAKPADSPLSQAPAPGVGAVGSSTLDDAEFLSTRPSPENPVTDSNVDFEKTQLGAGLGKSAVSKAQGTGKKPVAASGAGMSYGQDGSGFSTSKLFAVELSDEATDPELEEAAIRFANGDNLGAEEGLREALERTQGQSEFAEFWIAALFDLYRATDQQGKFDALALDFAAQLGRSAPAWHSMKESLSASDSPDSVHTAPQDLRQKPNWEAPATLDLSAMGELRLALANAQMPWYLSWRELQEIQPEALKMLGSLFAQWCVQDVRLRFDGAAHLEDVLRSYTPSGDKSTHNTWWRLRMDALRVMRMQDQFELVALDYCVTFEVSPPSWQDAVCEYLHDGVSVARTPLADSVHVGDEDDAESNDSAATSLVGLDGLPPVVVALEGEILGDAAAVLQKLEEGRHQGQGRLVVSCARLIRVDFSAAGSILNWVANRQEEGFSVQFRDVHRLVGAFFNVIGINEHAKVVLRSN